MDLFEQHREQLQKKNAPLADRMRPRTLDDFVGQAHIVGPGRLLRRAIAADQLRSLIFYGPPGTGKTTLARIIANTTRAQFIAINAVLAGVKDIREAIDKAQQTLGMQGRRTILFVDEVHRFNKAQQDALLPHVENGILILIGATTENPYFEVNKALVSRSRIFELKSLTDADLVQLARNALADTERGYGKLVVSIDDDALEHLVAVASGDARGVLGALELAVETTDPGTDGVIRINRAIAEESIQRRAVLYDKDGDAHYDAISAFIKSVRGSDPDAALYWMAKMVAAGEDPRFIFRRMLILAGEDVGMADPAALGVVISAAQAFDYVGMPEGRYHLAHACLYLCTATKSNSSMGFFDAIAAIGQQTDHEVPNHLRDSSRDAEGFGHGQGYLYPHAYRDHWVAQQYLPASLAGKIFYHPSNQGYEAGVQQRVIANRQAQIEAMQQADPGDPFSPGAESTTATWTRRTESGGGNDLHTLCTRIVEMAAVQRDSMVLDVNAKTGLLTLAALSAAVQGTVWSVAFDNTQFQALTQLSKTCADWKQPVVLMSPLAGLEEALCKEAGGLPLFDAVIGRGVCGAHADKAACITRCAALLRSNARLVFAEPVHAQGQRLSMLLTQQHADPQTVGQLRHAEELLFSDAANPALFSEIALLHEELADRLPGAAVRIVQQTYSTARRIHPGDIEHWFRLSPTTSRSLGDYIRSLGDPSAEAAIKSALLAHLANATHQWQSVMAFVCVQNG